MSNVKIKSAGNGFYIGGQLVKPGTSVTVAPALAADLIARGKAEAVDEQRAGRKDDDGGGGPKK